MASIRPTKQLTPQNANPLCDSSLPTATGHRSLTRLKALKTVLEVKAGDSIVDVYVTVVPIKSANAVLGALRTLIHGQHAIDLQHLRRFAKFHDLPAHLKSRLSLSPPTTTVVDDLTSLCLLVAPTDSVDLEALQNCISNALPLLESKGPTIWTTPVPRLAPTSQNQAMEWTASHWPTVYKKNNPFGPHPHILFRAESEMACDLDVWMAMAHKVARASRDCGIGEAVGAVIVQRENDTSHALVLAGDARWAHGRSNPKGNVMAHAVLRAIGIVAQKIKTAERNKNCTPLWSSLDELESTMFLDKPIHPEEHVIFDNSTVSLDGYLCHNLEIYLTHEPCVMCSMALLHSRFGRVVFDARVPATGGLCSEGTGAEAITQPNTTGLGHGLFWRKELNWSLLGWETTNHEDIETKCDMQA